MNLIAAIGWKVVPRVFGISPHGIGIAVGYAAGTAMLARRAERFLGVKRDHVWNFMTWAVVGVIVGSRLFFVVGHYGDLVDQGGFAEIFRIQNGGIVLYGGIFGAIVAAYPYIRKHGLPFLKLLDTAAPAFALGIAIGRIGDLVIGDHLGGPTDLALGFRYEGGELPGCGPVPPPFGRFGGDISCPALGQVVHQPALYDLISVAVLFPILLWLGRRPRRDGLLISLAAVWYAAGRLVWDFTRTTTDTYLGLRGTQWVSVALVAGGLIGLARSARRSVGVPRDAGLDEILSEEMVAEGAPVWTADEEIDPGVR